MKEIPILFSTAIVQAILEGRKSQTRRLVDVPDLIAAPDRFRFIGDSIGRDFPRPAIKYDDRLWYEWQLTNSNEASWVERCRWKVGDLLWVRESFRVNTWVPDDGVVSFRYEADGTVSPLMMVDTEDSECENFNRYWEQSCDDLLQAGYHTNEDERFEDYDYKALRLRPNIFLRKEAARIWLQVESIRVERLQDISEQDAQSEGVNPKWCKSLNECLYEGCASSCAHADLYENYMAPGFADYLVSGAKQSFRTLWQSINGTDSWQANPWVWVISFKVLSTTGKPVEKSAITNI